MSRSEIPAAAQGRITLDISEILPRFPEYRVAFGTVLGGALRTDRDGAIAAFVAETETWAAAMLAGVENAGDLPTMAAWRAAYRAFGSKKTSYRNACEALLRRIRGGDGLPRIHPLVDLYNAISVRFEVPVGCDDLARVAPPLAFRYGRPDDTFLDLAGDPSGANDPPAAGEVVYTDTRHVLCRRWSWRQDARTRITAETDNAVVVIQSLGPDAASRVEEATASFVRLAERSLGAACEFAVAGSETPRVSVRAVVTPG
ncbi:MAG TPA: phenylalanine--tRNA ligase beta subunit-related protein [Stellaceae bacterium]